MTPNKEFTKFCTPTSQTSTIEYARSTEPCNVSQIGNGDKKDSNFDDVQKRVATYVHLFRVQLLNGLSRNVENSLFERRSQSRRNYQTAVTLYPDALFYQRRCHRNNNGCRRS